MKHLAELLIVCMLFSCNQKETTPIDILHKGKWIDLTHNFDSSTFYWPTGTSFSRDTVFYGINDKNFFYSSFKYAAEEHGGTHLDAPIHFGEGQKTVEQLSISQLSGEGIVIDVSEKALKNKDYLITSKDFTEWEKIHGNIPHHSVVLLYTGYGQFWGDLKNYTGTLKTGPEAIAELHFPGLHPDAATWLVTNRKINAIGLDTPSIDYGQSTQFMAHRILSKKNIPIYENVANLDQAPPKGSYIVALPMKINGGSGAPLRIVAFLPSLQ